MPELCEHQREAVEFARTHPRWLNTSEYGTGKTCPAATWLKDLVPAHRVLIVCTSSKVDDWFAAVRTWGRDWWSIAILGGDRVTKRRQRWREFRKPHHVAIINFEGLQIFGKALLCYDVLLVDELHHAKNPTSLVSRSLAALGANALYVHGITGSPVLENLLDAYGVMRVVAPDVFGPSLTRFRDLWFRYESDRVCPQCGKNFGPSPEAPKCLPCGLTAERTYPKWKPRPMAVEFLSMAIHAISFRKTRAEIPFDWPLEVNADRIVVRLHPKVEKLMRALEKETSILLLGDVLTTKDLRARFQKLLCLSAGWIYGRDGRAVHIADRNPKVEALEEHLEEVRGRGQVVVWAVRPPDFELIGRAMTRLGMSYGCVQGSTPKRRRPDIMAEFNAGVRENLIAHPLCLGEGVDMIAHYGSYFSRTWSHLEFDQSRGRLVRMFQRKERVVFTQIAAAGFDEAVVDLLEGPKRNLLRDVMRTRALPVAKARRRTGAA